MEEPKQAENGQVSVRLNSDAGVHTPGLIRWCLSGWQSEKTRRRKQPFLDVMMGYGLPDDVATRLLDGALSYRVEGDTVVFDLDEPEARRIAQRVVAMERAAARVRRYRDAQARVKNSIEAFRRDKVLRVD